MLQVSRGISQFLTSIVRTNTRTLNAALHLSAVQSCEAQDKEKIDENGKENIKAERDLTPAELKRLQNDRTKVIPVETSMRYLKSAAYQQTYGEEPVWVQYRRNHLGMFAPRRTRKTCIRKGVISTGNPCPICRDEYLVLDHRNLELIKQFISPQTGEVLSYSKTGLCQRKHLELLVAVERARDFGLITFDVPFREYDYSEYFGEQQLNKQ